MAPFKKNKSATTKLPSLPSHLLHLSTLQLITRAAPFTHAQNAPLRSLTDLLGSYLSLLALAARDNADLAGRDSVSVWDVGRALDEFAGTSTSTGLRQLKEECKNSQGGGGLEGRQLRELAQGLSGPFLSSTPERCFADVVYIRRILWRCEKGGSHLSDQFRRLDERRVRSFVPNQGGSEYFRRGGRGF